MIRKYNKTLPSSYDALKKMSKIDLAELWSCYFNEGTPLVKPLWYKIMCDATGLKIEQSHLTRLNRYAKNPEECIAKAHKQKYLLKFGSQIAKTFKGKKHIVMVCHDGRFRYGAQYYKTLSAVALVICGHKVSGNSFFGLMNKNGGVVNEKN